MEIQSTELQSRPAHLLNTVIQKLNLKNDAALARKLEISPSALSSMRHHRITIGPSMLVRIHEAADINIKELRQLMGIIRNDRCV